MSDRHSHQVEPEQGEAQQQVEEQGTSSESRQSSSSSSQEAQLPQDQHHSLQSNSSNSQQDTQEHASSQDTQQPQDQNCQQIQFIKQQHQLEKQPLAEGMPEFIKMLESDATIDVAVCFSILGLIIMIPIIFIVQSAVRVHLIVVSLMFLGLTISLLIFKCLKIEPSHSPISQQDGESQENHSKLQ